MLQYTLNSIVAVIKDISANYVMQRLLSAAIPTLGDGSLQRIIERLNRGVQISAEILVSILRKKLLAQRISVFIM